MWNQHPKVSYWFTDLRNLSRPMHSTIMIFLDSTFGLGFVYTPPISSSTDGVAALTGGVPSLCPLQLVLYIFPVPHSAFRGYWAVNNHRRPGIHTRPVLSQVTAHCITIERKHVLTWRLPLLHYYWKPFASRSFLSRTDVFVHMYCSFLSEY